MPRFEPFRGVRYNPDLVSLDRVIAPPYDVIDAEERARLAAHDSKNAVLIELPEPPEQAFHDAIESRQRDVTASGHAANEHPASDDAPQQDGAPQQEDRYEHANRLFQRWYTMGVLARDPRPAFYAYRMTQSDGKTSTGVIGALHLSKEEGAILPHEETMPKPKSDRLDLLRATRVNVSPIWGLSLTHGLTAAFRPIGRPVAEATDDDQVRHQLWVVDDPAAIAETQAAIAESPMVIADGHHRYETARRYNTERHDHGAATRGDDFVMTFAMELSPQQLHVGAIHRTIEGLSPGVPIDEPFRRWFDMVRAGPLDGPVQAALRESQDVALITRDDAWLLSPKKEAFQAARSDLDSSVVALALSALPSHEVTYQNSREDALKALRRPDVQAAVLMRPVRVAQIAEWATSRRRMPPKTTYFFPKLRTGLVFRPLDE